MSKSYQQITLQLYKIIPELTSDIWKKIIQNFKLQEITNIFKQINKRSYYNYKTKYNIYFVVHSHLKCLQQLVNL